MEVKAYYPLFSKQIRNSEGPRNLLYVRHQVACNFRLGNYIVIHRNITVDKIHPSPFSHLLLLRPNYNTVCNRQ